MFNHRELSKPRQLSLKAEHVRRLHEVPSGCCPAGRARARAALLFGCVSGASGGKAGRSAGYTLLACPRALRAGGGLRLVTAASATDRADLTLRIGTTGEETVRGESSQ